jgi:hypothetical protein
VDEQKFQPLDMQDLINTLEAEGLLDTPEVQAGMLSLHEFMGDSGFDPESPEVYQAMLTTLSLVTSLAGMVGPVLALEWTGRFALRAYRDIQNRG